MNGWMGEWANRRMDGGLLGTAPEMVYRPTKTDGTQSAEPISNISTNPSIDKWSMAVYKIMSILCMRSSPRFRRLTEPPVHKIHDSIRIRTLAIMQASDNEELKEKKLNIRQTNSSWSPAPMPSLGDIVLWPNAMPRKIYNRVETIETLHWNREIPIFCRSKICRKTGEYPLYTVCVYTLWMEFGKTRFKLKPFHFSVIRLYWWSSLVRVLARSHNINTRSTRPHSGLLRFGRHEWGPVSKLLQSGVN